MSTLNMLTKFTEADFDSRFWESCSVWRLTVPLAHPFGNEVNELFLDLDYIVEVLPNGTCWHAPAMWEFHGITDLNFELSSSDSGFQNAPSGCLIESLNRWRVWIHLSCRGASTLKVTNSAAIINLIGSRLRQVEPVTGALKAG